MELSKLQHGRILTLEVTPLTEVGAEKIPRNGSELTLTTAGDLCALLLPAHPQPVLLSAPDSTTVRELGRLAELDSPRLCWLVAARAERNQVLSLTIQIHEFSERIHLPELKIGVDEKLVEDVGRQLRRRLSLNEARKWLAEQLCLGPSPGGKYARVLLVGRPDSVSDPKPVFRILGSRYALDVRKEPEGGCQAFRLRPSRSPVTPEEYRPIVLAEGSFEFSDRTIAGQMRQGIATELDQMVSAAGSYLGVWAEYQNMEENRLVAEARQFGWLSYNACSRSPDGCWTFQLALGSEWTTAQLRQWTTADRDFEASIEIPEILIGTTTGDQTSKGSKLLPKEKLRPVFRGECAGCDTQTIRLRPESQDTEVVPPKRGYIHISLRGDLKRIQRRRDAHNRILTLQTSIPQLRLLLENRPVPVRRVKAIEPLSAAAKAKFRGSSPTPRQVEAIRVALNTPDIAVIQGPPGTGKTRTIAAIIERLTEIAREQNDPFDRVLLTSFQHDAVENAAAMTNIYGLPAMKIGRRRGEPASNLPVEAWAQGTAAALEADLAARPRKPLRALLEEIRVRHAAYVQSPGTEDEAVRILREINALAGPCLPANLADRIAGVIHHLRLGTVGLDEDRQEAMSVVRGLRTQPESFGDDGPRMAWRVLDRLASGPWLTSDDKELLKRAKDWDSVSLPDFLADIEVLRNRLLDALQTKSPPSRVPLVNAEVVGVLHEVMSVVENRACSDVDESSDLAIGHFLRDLKADPHGLREAIEHYTVVLAATCQQAVGDRMAGLLSDDVEFDNVIVDEAARANPLDLLIPMSRAARRIILVGDHRQLPHLLEPEVERELERSVRDETRDQIRRSLFERMFLHLKHLEAKDGIKRWVTLDTQYRMHPVLGTFVSDSFYKKHGEAFGSPGGAEENPSCIHHLRGPYLDKLAVWKDIPITSGAEERAGSSWRRSSEAQWIAAEARRIMEEAPNLSLGIISFYTAQVEAIRTAMEHEGLTARTDDGELVVGDAWRTTTDTHGEPGERLRIGTVDAFQGKEFDIVILSVTRSNRIAPNDETGKRRRLGHLLLENRLCVAMSRQKRLLIVVGDSSMATAEVPGLHDFLKLCQGKHGAFLMS
jgi:hypothetical protein